MKSEYSKIITFPRYFASLTFFAVVMFAFTGSLRAQWVQTNGPEGGAVTCFAVSGSNLFAGTSGGVFLSTNNGTSWKSMNTGLTDTFVSALVLNGPNLFAGTEGGGVFLSTDNGASWTAENAGLTNPNIKALAVSGPNLFAGTYDNGSTSAGVFRSTDNGASWTPANNGMTYYFSIVYTFMVNGTKLFAGTSAFVFLSTDSGASWTSSTISNVDAFAAIGTNLFAGVYVSGAGSGSVYRSTDNGTSWTEVTTGLTNTAVSSLAVSGSNLFAGTYGGGIFLSTDYGTSWSAASTGLMDTNVYGLAVIGTNLFAWTDSGVWRRPLSDFGISSVAQTPEATSPAIQIFPNPLSQSTQISFNSEASGYADVSIVNQLGVEIAHLFSGELSVGNHSFIWNSAGIAIGTYECVVRTNGQVQTLPVVVR